MIRIEADLLIPGDGEPVTGGVLVTEGGQISYAGPAAVAPGAAGAEVITAPVVMPGLWDCHGHFIGARSMDLARLPQEPTALRAARSARARGMRGSASVMPLPVSRTSSRTKAPRCTGGKP